MQPDREYWDEIVDIYKVMYENMGLKEHKLSELLTDTKNKDGTVKTKATL
jgi:hypothetical protein